MEYNPMTGEIRSMTGPTKPNRAGAVEFFSGKGSPSSLEQASQTMDQSTSASLQFSRMRFLLKGVKEVEIPRPVVEGKRAGPHPLDGNRTGRDRLREPFDPPAGAGASSISSSLQVPDTSSRAVVQPRPRPKPIASVDEKVHVN